MSAGPWIEQVRKRVNLAQVDAEAHKAVRLIVAGPRREAFVAALRAGGPFDDDVLLASDDLPPLGDAQSLVAGAAIFCQDVDTTNGASHPDFAASKVPIFVARAGASGGGDETRVATLPGQSKPAPGRPAVYYLSEMTLAECRRFLLPDIAHAHGSNQVALAAAIPAFRSVVAAKITMDCAMNCLKIAGVSALADHIPVLGFVTGSIASAGDTIAITALQMGMLLRIAAAYGKRPELARILELAPVVGGGYGWRTLARELSGFIPIAGIPIKAAIAYAGTLVVGQAAAYYYETGLRMSPSAVGALYREASERAKNVARHFARHPKIKQRSKS